MTAAYTQDFGKTTVETDASSTPSTTPRPKPSVDLVPVSFGATFQNPCFWILVGIAGTIAAQYLLKSHRKD
jgi:hypothetical protein